MWFFPLSLPVRIPPSSWTMTIPIVPRRGSKFGVFLKEMASGCLAVERQANQASFVLWSRRHLSEDQASEGTKVTEFYTNGEQPSAKFAVTSAFSARPCLSHLFAFSVVWVPLPLPRRLLS